LPPIFPLNCAGQPHRECEVHTRFTADFLTRCEIAFPTSEMEISFHFIRNEKVWQLGPPRRVRILAAINKAKSFCNAVAFARIRAGKSPDLFANSVNIIARQ
jgi:hypothetical protein